MIKWLEGELVKARIQLDGQGRTVINPRLDDDADEEDVNRLSFTGSKIDLPEGDRRHRRDSSNPLQRSRQSSSDRLSLDSRSRQQSGGFIHSLPHPISPPFHPSATPYPFPVHSFPYSHFQSSVHDQMVSFPTHLPPPPMPIQEQLRLQKEQNEAVLMSFAGTRDVARWMAETSQQHQHHQQHEEQPRPEMMSTNGEQPPMFTMAMQRAGNLPPPQHRSSLPPHAPQPFVSPNPNERMRSNSDSDYLLTPVNATSSSSISGNPASAYATFSADSSSSTGYTPAVYSNFFPDPTPTDGHQENAGAHPTSASTTYLQPHALVNVGDRYTSSPEMLSSPGMVAHQNTSARSKAGPSPSPPLPISPAPTPSGISPRPAPHTNPSHAPNITTHTRSSSLLSTLPQLQTSFTARTKQIVPPLAPPPLPSSSIDSHVGSNQDTSSYSSSIYAQEGGCSEGSTSRPDPFLSDPSINPSPISGFPSDGNSRALFASSSSSSCSALRPDPTETPSRPRSTSNASSSSTPLNPHHPHHHHLHYPNGRFVPPFQPYATSSEVTPTGPPSSESWLWDPSLSTGFTPHPDSGRGESAARGLSDGGGKGAGRGNMGGRPRSESASWNELIVSPLEREDGQSVY